MNTGYRSVDSTDLKLLNCYPFVHQRSRKKILQVLLRDDRRPKNGCLFGKLPKGGGGSHFRSKKLHCRFCWFQSGIFWGKKAQCNFQKRTGEGGHGRLEVFKKTSILGDPVTPKDNLKNIDIDMVILENIDIDMDFLENINTDIDKGILKNIDIDKIFY